MPSTSLYDTHGKVVGAIDLPEDWFGLKPRTHHLWRGITTYLSNQRLGTVNTKRKGDVSGGGKKPFRQKGTGNARQGSIRAVQFVGGGIAHGPKPRDYSIELPKKMRRQALAESLSDKAQRGKLIVVEGLSFDIPKTKNASAFLKGLGVNRNKNLIVLERAHEATIKSFRNLSTTTILPMENLNLFDVLNCEVVVFTKTALGALNHGISPKKHVDSEEKAK
jgi:large subunit ribosomal protein L4